MKTLENNILKVILKGHNRMCSIIFALPQEYHLSDISQMVWRLVDKGLVKENVDLKFELTSKGERQMTLAEQFAKLNKIEWHESAHSKLYPYECSCGFSTYDDITFCVHLNRVNPTFQHAEDILKVMMAHPDKNKFIDKITTNSHK